MLKSILASKPTPKNLSRFGFVVAMAKHIYSDRYGKLRIEHPWNEKWLDSLDEARAILNDFLRREKIKFGDDMYCWDRSGARDVAGEYLRYD